MFIIGVDKKMIPFKAKIRKFGESFVITIPKQYVENGLLNNGEEYQFNVEEIEDGKTKN